MTFPALRNAAFFATVALVLSAGSLGAQQRRVEQVYTADGIRLDYPADAVWRVKARQVAQQRARMLSAGRYGPLNAPQAAVSGGALQGTLFLPSILIAFKNTDTTALSRAGRYDSIFYTTTPLTGRNYTLRTFYQEMSHGLFSIQGLPAQPESGTFGWFVADSNDTWYLEACGAGNDPLGCPAGRSRLHDVLVKALQQADPGVNFAGFDNNGPDNSPNSGDDDGLVDLVQFVMPVVGAECSGPGYNAHHFSLSGLVGNTSGRYTTNDARSGGGSIRVDNYQIVSGVGGVGPLNPCTDASQIMGIGTAAHEAGHGLALPDLYDSGLIPTSEGIGEWGLMGSGNYRSLNSPAHLDAWSLQQLGWVTVVPLTGNDTVRVGAVELSDTVFVIRPLAPNPRGEYFLLENKQSQLADTANMTVSSNKQGGLLVWHVDSTKIAQNLASNTVNSGSIHGLALVQADGKRDLDSLAGSGGNRGDAGDPYPGSTVNRRFSYDTSPRAVMNNDTTVFAGFELDSVTQVVPQGEMVFKLSLGGPTVVRATDTTAQVKVDGVKYHRFAQLLTPDSAYTIAMDSAQLTPDSLRQYVFESWSNGKARSDTIHARLAGDSISAAVSLRLRVRATASAGGTVTSYPAHASDTLAAGYYALKDTTFSLKATPLGGKLFFGWSGDTTSGADSLALTLSKPYTVVASFGDPLAGSAGTPPGGVMGTSYTHTLTATGGTGTYSWQVVSGALPDGLNLSAAGVVSGIPSTTGSFSATARVTSGSQTADVTVAVTVTAPTLVAADVVSQILGTRAVLTGDQLTYLDLLGNNNGGFDVGDFLAWVDATGAAASPQIAAALAQLSAAAPPAPARPGRMP